MGLLAAVAVLMAISQTNALAAISVSAEYPSHGGPVQCYPDGTPAIQVAGTQNQVTIDIPDGLEISSLAIKSGNNVGCVRFDFPPGEQPGSATYSLPGTNPPQACYTVTLESDGDVVVMRVFVSDQCQGISHVQYLTRTDTTTFPTTLDTTLPTTNPGATPELDSVVLFGAGVAALAGYALYQRRKTSRQS